MKFLILTLAMASVLFEECQGKSLNWTLCGLCGEDDIECKTTCKDIPVPVPVSRFRRQDCRFCTKDSNYACWARCQFYLSNCPDLCRNSASNDPNCVVNCMRQYGQWK